MPRLSVTAECHVAFRTSVCCLCRQWYDEQLVAAVLRWDGAPLGELCPRCLNLRPTDPRADLLRRWSPGLRKLAARLCDRSARVAAPSGQPRAEQQPARSVFGCMMNDPCWLQSGPRAGPDEDASRAQLVAELSQLGSWPLSIDALISAERDALRGAYPCLSEDDLDFLVDERYRLMLAP